MSCVKHVYTILNYFYHTATSCSEMIMRKEGGFPLSFGKEMYFIGNLKIIWRGS